MRRARPTPTPRPAQPSTPSASCRLPRFLALAAAFSLTFISLASIPLAAQVPSGTLVCDLAPGRTLTVHGALGFSASAKADASGRIRLLLPYGTYQVDAGAGPARVWIPPGDSASCPSQDARAAAYSWVFRPPEDVFPSTFGLTGILLNHDPGAVTDPLDYTGLDNNRIGFVSQNGISWTATAFRLQGIDATDAWQPGLPVVFPDPQAVSEVALENGIFGALKPDFGPVFDIVLRQPDSRWHASLTSSNTGAPLASNNLPAARFLGEVKQPEQYQWFTNDDLQTGGSIGRRADLFLSSTGQWATQKFAPSSPPANVTSRLLFANARGRFALTSRDQIDALYSGSRIDLSNFGIPAGLEALTSWRGAPAYAGLFGFAGQPEVDHMDFVQAGWTHRFDAERGVWQTRYGYSVTHLDTRLAPPGSGPSQVDLLGSAVTGPAPLANLAIRTRHEIENLYEPGFIRTGALLQKVSAGFGWERADPRNRMNAPMDLNLITAAGAPAYAVELNTPVDTHERVDDSTLWARDDMQAGRHVQLTVALSGDFARGSLPAQSSPAGYYAAQRVYAGTGDRIAWNSVSPGVGIAVRPPGLDRVTLRASYQRTVEPLAGRYLDFGNPNSLGGQIYQWLGAGAAGPLLGPLLQRFGGPYSAISPDLQRPYADEFDVQAEAEIGWGLKARTMLFRRDEKDRIAAVNTGVTPADFTPVAWNDLGPAGVPGAPGASTLTLYSQSPATLGADRYLLTNPAGLRDLNEGFTAEVTGGWKWLSVRAAFTAMKAWGPANPGNGILVNDPGVIGSLYADPNTLAFATGHAFVDRAFLGKMEAYSRLPRWLGGVEISNVADYEDGLPFAREVLATGLPQGPFLTPATVRGSPEGGNRSEYLLNWNLRVSREFGLPVGRMRIAADVLNVANGNNRIQEIDLSGPNFLERLPLAIEPPRFVRLEFRYEF